MGSYVGVAACAAVTAGCCWCHTAGRGLPCVLSSTRAAAGARGLLQLNNDALQLRSLKGGGERQGQLGVRGTPWPWAGRSSSASPASAPSSPVSSFLHFPLFPGSSIPLSHLLLLGRGRVGRNRLSEAVSPLVGKLRQNVVHQAIHRDGGVGRRALLRRARRARACGLVAPKGGAHGRRRGSWRACPGRRRRR